MSQNLRELIDAIEEGNSLRIQNAFEREMSLRIASAIQERKMEVAAGIFESKETDLETIEELSKNTLGQYIKKASHDVAARGAATRQFSINSDEAKKKGDYLSARKWNSAADKTFAKSWKRREGMARAVDKLTKEELTPKQKQLDHDGDGKIEGSDLAKVRKHGAKKV